MDGNRALASPALLGMVGAAAPVALLLVATASAAAVVLWQRWRFLSLGAFLIATPQWVAYLLDAVAIARGAAAVLVLYAVSAELVTALAPQQGQAAMSALWALTGVATLLVGLIRDLPLLRQGALALLAIAVTKVFVYDLASLDSMYRVASLIALGLLLLVGAFAWQRFRPRPLRDLRSMPEALR